jgi:hypothetical protein
MRRTSALGEFPDARLIQPDRICSLAFLTSPMENGCRPSSSASGNIGNAEVSALARCCSVNGRAFHVLTREARTRW